jgi:hypothetical protein
VSAIAVVVFVKSPQTSGNGLALELVGLVSGLILGAIGANLLMDIRKDPRTGNDALILFAVGLVLARVVRFARVLGPGEGADQKPRTLRRLRDTRSAL